MMIDVTFSFVSNQFLCSLFPSLYVLHLKQHFEYFFLILFNLCSIGAVFVRSMFEERQLFEHRPALLPRTVHLPAHSAQFIGVLYSRLGELRPNGKEFRGKFIKTPHYCDAKHDRKPLRFDDAHKNVCFCFHFDHLYGDGCGGTGGSAV